MPELPEVESVARALWDGPPSLYGQKIQSISILSANVVSQNDHDCFKQKLYNGEFKSLKRIGKYLLFSVLLTGGKETTLAVHLRMTGRLFLVSGHDAIERHTRLAIFLDSGHALRFDDPRKFGRIWLVDNPDDIYSRLGPDALTVEYEPFRSAMGGTHRLIKPLLLDQKFLAGIGNIYADEILFRCCIHPQRTSSDLSESESVALHAAIISVLNEAVCAKGANIEGVFKAGEFPVAVYGRRGAACHCCGNIIEKIIVGQRGTSFCPTCQPLTQNKPEGTA